MTTMQEITANAGTTTRLQFDGQLNQTHHLLIGNIGQPHH
jgi:hypothetical protein